MPDPATPSPTYMEYMPPKEDSDSHISMLRRMAALPNQAEELGRAWERECALFHRTAGRQTVLHDIFVRTPLPKPFLYLDRQECF